MTTATNGRQEAIALGLTSDEYDLIVSQMGREPTETELGMYSVMWSEHCGYKYSRPILAYFKQYKEALETGGMENAGIIPIGDGLGVCFKVESHNHPSAVEPYQGAATGVGGILRDIFTMGARPIACLNSLRFGPLAADAKTSKATAKRNRYLFEHVVQGIAGYGNCVGVPTVAGEVAFHPRYSGNPLVNAMAVGIVKLDEATTAAAKGVGNPVIYLGSATGKDGIKGASFASTALGEDSADKRPNVQIGDPFAEKQLIEATLEALQTGAIVSIQDMGAAGITCSTVEMSAKGRVGMEIDLDLVPMRESDMTAFELMLSESQERMLCVAEAGREGEVLAVFRKWGLRAEVVGHVIEEEVVRVRRFGSVEAEVYPPSLADQCPSYTNTPVEPEYYRAAKAFDIAEVPEADPQESLKTLLRSPNIASKRWVFQQYDQQVQTQTAVLPGQGDAAVLAPRGTRAGIAFKIDGNALQQYLDPYVGGQLAVCEAARNVACTGGLPSGATDGLNFGNPTYGNVYWQFDRCVKGISEACEALKTPVISGNVSFYNESDLGEILPTAMIGMLGVLKSAENRLTMKLTPGSQIGLLSVSLELAPQAGLGASQYLVAVHGIEDGVPISPNLEGERSLCHLLARLAEERLIHAAHDISEGGFAVALTEMCMAGNCGAVVILPESLTSRSARSDGALFGEFPGFVLIGFEPDDGSKLHSLASEYGITLERIGSCSGDAIKIGDNNQTFIDQRTEELRVFYETAIQSLLLVNNM